jgi:hypothetical protein
MAFIGTPLDTRNTFQSLQGKRFNGDGSTTAFTLDVAPSSTLDIEVFVGNVRQDPNSAYTLSGTTLTFTGAPPSGTNNIYVVHQAKSVGTIDPPATETVAKTFSGAVTMSGALTATTIATTGAVTATVDGTGLKSVGANAQVSADASSGYAALITDGAASQSSYVFFQTNGTDKARLTADSSGNFEIGSGGTTTGLKVDSAGHVTMPLQSAFNATSATQSNVTGDETQYQMTFGTETIDRNADFNTNGTFTAPVTGLYLLSANVGGGGFSSHTRMLNFIVTSNRTYIATLENLANTHNGNSFGFNVSCLADMDANDTAFVQVRVDGGSKVIDLDDTCRFSGCLIA